MRSRKALIHQSERQLSSCFISLFSRQKSTNGGVTSHAQSFNAYRFHGKRFLSSSSLTMNYVSCGLILLEWGYLYDKHIQFVLIFSIWRLGSKFYVELGYSGTSIKNISIILQFTGWNHALMILHVAAWSLIKHIQQDDRQTSIHCHIDVCFSWKCKLCKLPLCCCWLEWHDASYLRHLYLARYIMIYKQDHDICVHQLMIAITRVQLCNMYQLLVCQASNH